MKGKFNLFCLHHAGGTKYAYVNFENEAPHFLNMRLLEYPGRGQRISEEILTDVNVLAKKLVEEIKDELQMPYSIYGHSMGALVGLLMAREIQRLGYNSPRFLFFTGSGGPSVRIFKKIRHLLPRPELEKELKELGGISDAVFEEPEIMDFFLPIIRADFQAIETYKYKQEEQLNIPINIAIGTQEEITGEEVQSWQKETRWPVEIMRFHGNHFFIYEHQERLMKIIAEKFLE